MVAPPCRPLFGSFGEPSSILLLDLKKVVEGSGPLLAHTAADEQSSSAGNIGQSRQVWTGLDGWNHDEGCLVSL